MECKKILPIRNESPVVNLKQILERNIRLLGIQSLMSGSILKICIKI